MVSNQDLICEGQKKKNAFISDVILLPTDVHLIMSNYWHHVSLEEGKNFPKIINCTTFHFKMTMSLIFNNSLHLLSNGKIHLGCFMLGKKKNVKCLWPWSQKSMKRFGLWIRFQLFPRKNPSSWGRRKQPPCIKFAYRVGIKTVCLSLKRNHIKHKGSLVCNFMFRRIYIITE